MWSLTESELRSQPSVVLQGILRGDMLALSQQDGVHRVIATRTSTMPTSIIRWEDYLRDTGAGKNVYSRVADDDERIALTQNGEVIYFLPIHILAPPKASQPEIETWLETYADDWVVGPTFVSVTKETTDKGVRITALRL